MLLINLHGAYFDIMYPFYVYFWLTILENRTLMENHSKGSHPSLSLAK